MSNLIMNFIVSIMGSVVGNYFCKMLDKINTYLKNFIKEIWNTYSLTYENLFFIFIFYISLITFWIIFLNPNIYTIIIYA
jgi:hypothetical protein